MFQDLELGSPKKILTKNQNSLKNNIWPLFCLPSNFGTCSAHGFRFSWKYESWKFTFWRNESWHFCHHMTPRAGAWEKNIKHCQAFYKIVRLAALVLSRFRLQGWPILSTVPCWIWIALWILTTIFHFKYSSIKVTFVTELQSKLFNHQPGLNFFSEQVEVVNCTNFASQRHSSRQNTLYAHCQSWGLGQH